MLDYLFVNCKYPSFSEMEIKTGNIGIKEGKIIYISNNLKKRPESKHTILCDGKILSPGFIDIHMHEEDFLNEGEKYIISKMMLQQGVTTCVGGQCGVLRQSTELFKESIYKLGGAPVNYILLTGYNTLRTNLGLGRFDKASKEEIKKIAEKIQVEIDSGSSGITFGIEYDPGITKEEIIEVLNLIEEDNLLVSIHYRGDGNKAIDSIEEMIDIQRKTNKKLQISHLSSCSAMGQMEEALNIINIEIEKNPLLNYDTYPYNAFSTMIGSEVFSDGCFEHFGTSYDSILLTGAPYKNKICNKEIFEDCRENHPDVLAVAFVMNEEEIIDAIKNKYGMIASDGIINNGQGHPRAAGTFPRVLGKYVREEKQLSMLDALKKMTLLPASRLNLKDRGQIELGNIADLVLFNPETIIDEATYENINLKPKGIDMVLIKGMLALKDGKIINEKLGEFIGNNL